jgi:hypothetical protein
MASFQLQDRTSQTYSFPPNISVITDSVDPLLAIAEQTVPASDIGVALFSQNFRWTAACGSLGS